MRALFTESKLTDVLAGQLARAHEKIAQLTERQLLEVSNWRLVEPIVDSLRVDPIELDRVEVEARPRKVQLPHTPDRDPRAGRISGLEVRYFVPFTGSPWLFDCRPDHGTQRPPRADVKGDELVLAFYTRSDAADTVPDLEDSLDLVEQYLSWQLEDIDAFNEQLEETVLQSIEDRAEEAQRAQSSLEDLGFTIRETAAQPPRRVPAEPDRGSPPTSDKAWRFDVALSFAGEQRPYVDSVATALKEAGVSVFYDAFAQGELWGRNLAEEFDQIFGQDSRFVVLFVSREYLDKSWPNHEPQSAIAARIERQEAMVLPVVFDVSKVPGLPSSIAYLSAERFAPQELAQLIIERLG